MDLLQLLNKDDLESLAATFGNGLDEQTFIATMTSMIAAKAAAEPSEYAHAVRKWKPKALQVLFQSIDYNMDGTLQYAELTNFAINSALHHTRNQAQRVDLQFRDYHLVLPPQPTSYGSTTVINAENYNPMSEQVMKGRGHFKDQSSQLKHLFYLKSAKRFVVEGFTRVTLHNAVDPDPISRLVITGNIIDVTTAHNNTYLVCSTDQNLIEVYEQATSLSAQYVKRKALHTDRAVTQFLKADSGLGTLPGWFGGTGDREGLIRYCNMERLHAQLTLLGHSLDSLTVVRRKIHNDEISSLHFINPRFGGETIVSAGHDNRIVLHDVETGAIRFEPLHAHDGIIRQLALSNIHNVGFSIGSENFACMFHLDHMQHSVMKLEDFKDPHAHKLVGVACVTNTHQVITADAGGLLKLWDIRQMRSVRSFHVPPLEVDAITVTQKLKHHRSYGMPEPKPLPSGARTEIQINQKCALLSSIVYCDETKRVYAVGKETSVFQYDTSTLLPKAHETPLIALTYNEVEEQLITASATELKLWNVRNGCCTSDVHNLFLEHDGSIIPSANISAVVVDHVGGKRVFVGSTTGHVVCAVPATGKAEWCVVVRFRTRVQFLIFCGKLLFVGFGDGNIYSLDVNDPAVFPRAVFEPGTTTLLPTAKFSRDLAPEHLFSPSSVYRKYIHRKSKARLSMFGGMQPAVPQSYKTAEVRPHFSNNSEASPDGDASGDSAEPSSVQSHVGVAQMCVSHILKLFILYSPTDQSLLGMEFNGKTCFSVAPSLSTHATAMCFVKESPLTVPSKPSAPSAHYSTTRGATARTARASPSVCGLSVFAVGLANGVIQFYSIHMAEVASRLSTTLLLSMDVLDGICVNVLVCVQNRYLCAGCDSSQVHVWDVTSLLESVATFDLPVIQPKSFQPQISSVVGKGVEMVLGDFLSDARDHNALRTHSITTSTSSTTTMFYSIDDDWIQRMSAVHAAINTLRGAFAIGSITLQDQTYVSGMVKISQSGVVACASGDLDSIVRLTTIDGDEIGMLALGRSEEDALDALNSHKRNRQPIRPRVEGNLLNGGRKGDVESPLSNAESPASDHNSPYRFLMTSTRALSASSRETVLTPRHHLERVGSNGGLLQGHASPSAPPPDDHQIHDAEGSPFASYYWEHVFTAREWHPPDNFFSAMDLLSEGGSNPETPQARSHRLQQFVPPALSPTAIATHSVDKEKKIPCLVIDFLRIQQRVDEQTDDEWTARIGDDKLEMKKQLKKVRRRIRLLQRQATFESDDFEKECPEAVRRLAKSERHDELRRLQKTENNLSQQIEGRLLSFLPPVGQHGTTDSQMGEKTVPSNDELQTSEMKFNTSAFAVDMFQNVPLAGSLAIASSTTGSMSPTSKPAHQDDVSRSLESLAKRKQTLRSRELASQLANVNAVSTGAPLGSIIDPALQHQSQALRMHMQEHHTDLARLSHRLVTTVERVPQPRLRKSSPHERQVSPEILENETSSGHEEDQLDDDLDRFSDSERRDTLAQMLDVPSHKVERLVPELPAGVSIRKTSPDLYSSKAEQVDAVLRAARQSTGSPLHIHKPTGSWAKSVVVHHSGELSMRGVMLKQASDAKKMQRKVLRERELDMLRMKKAHVTSQKLGELLDSGDDDDSQHDHHKNQESNFVSGKLPLRSKKSVDRVHALVFPPIVKPNQPLFVQRNTGRTMQPVPEGVSGLLAVRPAQMTSPPNSSNGEPRVPVRIPRQPNTAR